jgi:hypothetical protein
MFGVSERNDEAIVAQQLDAKSICSIRIKVNLTTTGLRNTAGAGERVTYSPTSGARRVRKMSGLSVFYTIPPL